MILSNEGIRKALSSGDLVIDPPPGESQYTTSAVDLHLGDKFKVWDNSRIQVPGVSVELNLADQHFDKTAAAYLIPAPVDPGGEYVLRPGSFVLAITRERVHLKRSALLAARVEGRSSFARLGLVVHLTAPIIHAGFDGHITLEMVNFGPFHFRLVPTRTRVCQLIFERLESPPSGEVQTTFQGQVDPSGGRPRA